MHSAQTESRHPSEIEDDVCFPMSGQGLEDDGPELHYFDQQPMAPEVQRAEHASPFDFNAIENFADEERERTGTAGTWPTPPAPGTSPHGQQQGNKASLPLGVSPDNAQNGLYSRRPRRITPPAGPAALTATRAPRSPPR